MTAPTSRADRLAQRLSQRNAEGKGEEERDRPGPDAEGGEHSAAQPEPDETPAPPEKDVRAKFQAYVLKSVQDEAKAIVYWTNNRPGGYASLTELAENALMREIERLRGEFTGGAPFPPMPPDQRLPTRPPRRH